MMKKLNKHHIFILTGVVALFVVGIVASVLLQKSNVFQFDYKVEKPIQDSDIVIDANTAIDGKRDEKFWNDNTLVFTETKSGIKVTSWAHLGKNGLYLFTETDDKSVYWSKEKQFFENDSVEYYIDPRPEHSLQLDTLKEDVKVRTDNIQVRVDTEGRSSTWFGRKTESDYPWVEGDFKVLTAAVVDGEENKKNGASGYGIETFIPWEAMGLNTTPEEIGVMPAFNNVDNREDTARKWFTVKGMNHAAPTSYARVDENGFVQIAEGITLEKELTADWNDKAYKGESITLTEVNATNGNPETRGELKAFLGDEGVYFLVAVKDKVLSRYADGIWDNDGIEIVIDTQTKGGDTCFRDGIFRLAVDIDEGIETDICMTGYDDYVALRRAAFSKTAVSEYKEKSAYDYKNTLVYEVMVPYSSMGLTKKPSQLSFAWAVKSPNETAYILNRRNGVGEMEGQDWLWTNRHYPQNPDEYYILTKKGLVGDYKFPEWTAWEKCKVRSQAPTRYDYRGFADKNGLYINMVQYVDNIAYGGVGGSWKDLTHIEMEVWNENVGHGLGGTYLAFFPDGSNYINSMTNVTALENKCTITDRGANYTKGYRYMISYEIYLGFKNNVGSKDEPYAYVQMMSMTPGESNKGYEKSSTIMKDGDRMLWTDDCKSYEFRKDGIVAMNAYYTFPDWTPWENCKIRSQAQTRYDYRGYAADDGVYINMVQYVDKVAYGGAGDTWKDITHVEMELWNGDVGYGWDGTYLAFFPDGSDYINNTTNVDTLEYKCTIKDRGKNYTDGYRYMISYEIYLGFANNVGGEDGPYAYVQMMSITPGESKEGYENSLVMTKDEDRKLWTDHCQSYEFRENGIVAREHYDEKVEDRVAQWKKRGNDGKTTVFIGDSTYDTSFWANFYTESYPDKDALCLGIGGTTTYDWEVWAKGWLSEINPKQIVINIGGNNLYDYGNNVEETVSALQKLFTVMHEQFPNTPIYWTNMKMRAYDDVKNARRVEINKQMEVWCGKQDYITYVDVANKITSDMLREDETHVKFETYKIYTDALAEAGLVMEDLIGYDFPDWTPWEECKIRSQAQTRYDYRGYAAEDGVYINMVQYVDKVAYGGTSGTWKDITHVEMELFNPAVGYGWDGTYLAFFTDGSYYINNTTNVTALEYKCTVTDRGENYGGGYRYMIFYEIYLGFENNVKNGPYAYIQMMSMTPGESKDGYENSITLTKDEERKLWTDLCNSYEFHKEGITAMDHYNEKVADRKAQWQKRGNDGKTTLFIGDSGFDTSFWSNFYTKCYPGKDALCLGIGGSASYDWEAWTKGWLSETNPKQIVISIGGNNIWDYGNSVEETVSALQKLFTVMHEEFPNTPIYWTNLKMRAYDDVKNARRIEINKQMEAWCEKQDYITCVDIASKITSDMLREDKTHVKLECYKVYTDALAEAGLVMEEFTAKGFPKIADFSTIKSDWQSVDPDLYNFQMWCTKNGFYAYFVQKLPSVTLDNTNSWKNTHVEMNFFNPKVGYGWGGTYIALFPNGNYYINNTKNVKDKSLIVNIDQSNEDETIITYYFYLGFDNSTSAQPYAYVKQYQFLPGVDTSNLNSQTVTRDKRLLVTGDEKSFQVHSTINAKMYK